MAEVSTDLQPGRLKGREHIRPLVVTVAAVAAVWAGTLWLPGPFDTAVAWFAYLGSAVLLWTRGPRVGVDRRSALLMGIPLLGGIMAITALWRAFSPRPYWRDYPGWRRRGWTVAIGFSAAFAAMGVWGALRDAGAGAAAFEEVALAGFEAGDMYADERIATADILTTIDVSRERRLAVVRVETTGGLVAPEVVNLLRGGGALGTVWERDHSFRDRYEVACVRDRYCLYVFGRDAVRARLEAHVPELAPRLAGVPTDVPVRNGVVFIRNRAQLGALSPGGVEIVAYDAAGNKVPPLRGRLGAHEFFRDPKPAPGVIVVEE